MNYIKKIITITACATLTQACFGVKTSKDLTLAAADRALKLITLLEIDIIKLQAIPEKVQTNYIMGGVDMNQEGQYSQDLNALQYCVKLSDKYRTKVRELKTIFEISNDNDNDTTDWTSKRMELEKLQKEGHWSSSKQ